MAFIFPAGLKQKLSSNVTIIPNFMSRKYAIMNSQIYGCSQGFIRFSKSRQRFLLVGSFEQPGIATNF
ncbi:hypothetical protein LC593_12315 [Nostoc sp. CHAB 5844]|nr:hypothetical protein [Nostoc sp. CHAB 5844]